MKAIAIGFAGAFGLALFYFLVTGAVSGDWQYPGRQFQTYWYLMAPLIIGFGTQVGLFWHLRGKRTASVGASAGVSGLSMVACCAHHLADIVPFLGLAGFGLLLSQYQVQLLFLGILSNLAGIMYLLVISRR